MSKVSLFINVKLDTKIELMMFLLVIVYIVVVKK